MEFRTVVPVIPCKEKISYKSPVLMAGSCFSDNIGDILKQLSFPVLANPFGVLYNPFSISLLLKRSLDGKMLSEDDVFEESGIFKSFLFHSSFAAMSFSELKEKADKAMKETCNYLKDSSHIFITLGTGRYYRLNRNNSIVANCHKQNSSEFSGILAGPDDCAGELISLAEMIRKINPGVVFVYTISPVRYLKDGVPGAQLDKAVLFCALEKLLTLPGTYYFPAYEIMTDELRDYRFYCEDMVHPSPQAVQYIFEKFSECFFNEETKILSEKIRKIKVARSHRPMFPDSKQYIEFSEKLKKEEEIIRKDHPYIRL